MCKRRWSKKAQSVGIEPTTFWFEARRAVHCATTATRAFPLSKFLCVRKQFLLYITSPTLPASNGSHCCLARSAAPGMTAGSHPYGLFPPTVKFARHKSQRHNVPKLRASREGCGYQKTPPRQSWAQNEVCAVLAGMYGNEMLI